MITIGGISFNLRLTFLIILSTLLPMIDYYGHRVTEGLGRVVCRVVLVVWPQAPFCQNIEALSATYLKPYDRVLLYFVVPMLLIILLFRESPAEYGFKIGDWRVGLKYTLIGCGVMAVILWFLARGGGMQTYYEAKAGDDSVFRLIYITGVDLWGWEFIWRGFILFGMARILGPGPAIFLQAVPFAFMHLGKPEIETLSTIFGGAAFGYAAWQSGSFLYPFLIHWFLASFTMLIATGRF